jgi:hypothetical protein
MLFKGEIKMRMKNNKTTFVTEAEAKKNTKQNSRGKQTATFTSYIL